MLRVLAVLASAAAVFGLLWWERQVAGANPVLTTVMILCVVAGLLSAAVLVFLAAEYRVQVRDEREEMEAWRLAQLSPHPVETARRTTG